LLPAFGGKPGQCPVSERMWHKELMVFDWLRYPTTLEDIDHAIKLLREYVNAEIMAAK